jgi:hypothetical protein
MSTSSQHSLLARVLLASVALAGLSEARGQAVTTEGNVKLRPVIEGIDLVTDINVVGGSMYVTTQPGYLLRKSLSSGKLEIFLDLTKQVGRLGSHIPSLPGLGYPVAETYDERGLLGVATDPAFNGDGRFWVWYTNISERSSHPPNFFQWLTSTSQPWDMSQYDHVGYVAEYQSVHGVPTFQRTVLRIKRPYFNHTGFSSLVWSPELNTLVIGLGDGGSEYDPNNIAQDDNQLSGKLLKIDLGKLGGRDFTKSPPVATFSDLRNLGVPNGAFTPLLKGLRNPSKVSWEHVDPAEDGDHWNGDRWIKYLANTGQDTIEWIHAFDGFGLNFGFRPWEGIFPTSFEIDVPAAPGSVPQNDGRVLAYGLEASRLNPSVYRPFVHYTHLDKKLGPNANTGSTLYRGDGIPGLNGQLVFTDWISFVQTPKQGLLMRASVNRNSLQEPRPVKRFNVNLGEVNFMPGKQPLIFYTAINTDGADRLFIGGFKDIQFIVNQRNNALGNPPGNPNLAGGVYEVLKN